MFSDDHQGLHEFGHGGCCTVVWVRGDSQGFKATDTQWVHGDRTSHVSGAQQKRVSGRQESMLRGKPNTSEDSTSPATPMQSMQRTYIRDGAMP